MASTVEGIPGHSPNIPSGSGVGRRRLIGGRDVSKIDRITTDADVCGGRPCIRGLRVRVTDVLDLLAAGATRICWRESRS